MSDESDLIKQAQAGEAEAFEQLYKKFYLPIYKYIYYRVGQRVLAEDLTSDVFVRMVGKIDTWQPTGKPFIAWLYTIAGNLVRNDVKRQQLIQWHPLDERDADDRESVAGQISHKLQTEQLAEALEQLTEDQRQVIILRFIQGESIEKAAQTIGKNESAVKALQRRAIQALRRIFELEGVHV